MRPNSLFYVLFIIVICIIFLYSYKTLKCCLKPYIKKKNSSPACYWYGLWPLPGSECTVFTDTWLSRPWVTIWQCALVFLCFVNQLEILCLFFFSFVHTGQGSKGQRGVSPHEKTTTEGRPVRGPKWCSGHGYSR